MFCAHLIQFSANMGQQQSGFGGKRDERGGGDADKVGLIIINNMTLLNLMSTLF